MHRRRARPEESFTAYVGARWSTFYRFATLLVGEPAADSLTRTALVRALRSWDEVQTAGSPDDLVKQLLVREALRLARRRGATPEPDRGWEPSPSALDGSGVDRIALWSRIAVLPPRQRAVLMLRHHEDLDDASIAGTLGGSVRTVAADGAAAIESLGAAARESAEGGPAEIVLADPGPADLAEVFTARAEAASPPPAPVDDLLARAEREGRARMRRSALVAVVAVVALAASGLVVRGQHDGARRAGHAPVIPARRGTLEDLPAGATTTIGFTVGAKLYLGRVVIDLPGTPDEVVQARGVVFVYYGDGRILSSSTDAIGWRTLTRHAASPPVVDATGTYVAWLKHAPGAVVVRARLDAGGPRVATRFPVTPTCCDNPFDLDGVTIAGKVVASMGSLDRGWVWTPGSGAPVPFALHGGRVDQVAGQRMLLTASEAAVFDLSGAAPLELESAQVGDTEQIAALSPDGGQLAVTDGFRFIVLSAVSRNQPSLGGQIAVPRNAVVDAIRWQDEHRLLVQAVPAGASSPREWLLGCDTGTGRCATIAVGGAGMLLAK